MTWTLTVRGETFAIPGHLHRDWLLDAKHDPASDNTPPAVRFDPGGPDGAGPDGITAGPFSVSVGDALPLTLWAMDDGIRPRRRRAGDDGPPILIRWFLHQGPSDVEFSKVEPGLDAAGRSTTVATFSRPGTYVLRARVNDYSGIFNAGHSQCCWTNGYVTTWHDNRASNRNNPDATQWVGWGDRTVDEMAHVWVDVTYLEDDVYERLAAERQGRVRTDNNQ